MIVKIHANDNCEKSTYLWHLSSYILCFEIFSSELTDSLYRYEIAAAGFLSPEAAYACLADRAGSLVASRSLQIRTQANRLACSTAIRNSGSRI